MRAPLSQYRYSTHLLVGLSAATCATLALTGQAPVRDLVVLWAMAGVLSAGIWALVSRFRLDGGARVKAYAICWPLLAHWLCFVRCYVAMPSSAGAAAMAWPLVPLTLLALVMLAMSVWQQPDSIGRQLTMGLIIGLVSTVMPHVALWLTALPAAGYYMRSWSDRGIMSSLTGAVLAVWVVFCILFFAVDSTAAHAMLSQYGDIVLHPQLGLLPDASPALWSAYVVLVGLLLLVYSLSGLAIEVGQSVRAQASIQFVSVLGLLMMALAVLFPAPAAASLSTLPLLLAVQLTIHQANITTALNEWWTVAIVVASAALCLAPTFTSAI